MIERDAIPDPLEGLPRAHGRPPASARIRVEPEDFVVEELLADRPSGQGLHAWLRIRKRDANTAWVAARLAEIAGVGTSAVGYAGLKDRRAVATQWFSVDLAGVPQPRFADLEGADISVLEEHRHPRKLRRGAHVGNRFTLRLRAVEGERCSIAARIETLRERGVPNYFGAQRFGRDLGNLRGAARMFAGTRVPRPERGLYLSAARSMLFNRVVAARIAAGVWASLVPGDLVIGEGNARGFEPRGSREALAGTLERDLAALALHPTGPLWGRGEPRVREEALALENAALAALAEWRGGLEAAGLVHERRATRVAMRELEPGWESDDVLRLTFELPRGAFATAVLRELIADPSP